MKCRECQKKAVINMRQHRLALCKDHYPAWIVEQTQRFIQKYHMFQSDDRILVAVSGGKDSLSLWDILWKLGYQADGVYLGLGIEEGIHYSHKSQELAEKFALQRNLNLTIVEVTEKVGVSVPELASRSLRGQDKPCAVCGLTKRHMLNQAALEGGYDVLVTGHNLDDEAATLFGNTLHWKIEFLQRQDPVLPTSFEGLVRKAKPLFRFYEREMAAYALVRGIEYVYEECPFAEGSNSIYYKELLNQLEANRPGAKLSFFLSFLQAKETGFLSTADEAGATAFDLESKKLHSCLNCGQPTTIDGLCSFCRLIERVTEKDQAVSR